MAAINVFIKADYIDKKGEAPVIVEYTHLKKRWRINSEIKVNPSSVLCEYDHDTELFKLVLSKGKSKDEKSIYVNHNLHLQKIQLKLNGVINNLKFRSVSLSPFNVKTEFNKDQKDASTTKTNNKSTLEWYSDFISQKEHEVGAGINSYRSTYRHFKAFTQKLGTIPLSDLSKGFLDEFRNFLAKLGLNGTTIHKQVKNLRIFLNWIQSQDEIDQITIPSAYKKYNVKARYGDPVGLSVDQFIELSELDLLKYPELQRTRDLFVFGVSIGGPRHGDLKKLGSTLRKHGFNLDHGTINYFEGKTGNAHKEIFVNNFGLAVLLKYGLVFPMVPSNQRMNQNLKTIAANLKWTEIKFIPEYNAFGKLVRVNEHQLKDIISTKFMRKTAATIDNFLGIPTKTSMARTGHKTFAAYSRYVDVNKESLVSANKKWNDLAANKPGKLDQFVTLVEMHELQFAA